MKPLQPSITLFGVVLAALVLLNASVATAQEDASVNAAPVTLLGTGFTYQGELRDSEGPLDGACDFRFSIWSAPSGGNRFGNVETLLAVPLDAGRFVVTLNEDNAFGGNAFAGEIRWLEIAARCPAGEGAYEIFTPRQALAATPYALYSQRVPWSGITGIPLGFADGVDNDTTYFAGPGLTLAGTQFAVVFGGTGSATTVARSDHTHNGENWVGAGAYVLRLQNVSTAEESSALIAVVGAPETIAVVGIHTSQVGNGAGVSGITGSRDGIGVFGGVNVQGGVNIGVGGYTASPQGAAIAGLADAATGEGVGVFGSARSRDGWAGLFDGDVGVVGRLYKSAGAFRIDHPLDPANKYLSHSFVESPDMMNIYNGNVILDHNGEAWVELPHYFEALNRDYRYQLTPVGGPGPNLYIARKIQGNRFLIAGGAPGLEVSWQVTGIRQDAYALAHPIVVEEEKPESEKGLYLAAGALGAPAQQAQVGRLRNALAGKSGHVIERLLLQSRPNMDDKERR